MYKWLVENPALEIKLRKDIVRLATKYGRYGYRRITALLQAEGWRVKGFKEYGEKKA